jgi:flagellar basal-body rod modification protein FlgD
MTTTGAVSNTTSTSSYGLSTQGKQIGQLGKDDFLRLLVAQLQNQDPMNPMDDTQFVAQMAQFTTLESMQEMESQMALLLQVEQLGQANGLMGKQVEAYSDGAGGTIKGIVDSVKMVDGSAVLSVGGTTVNLQDIVSVVDGENTQLAQASSLIGKQVEAKVASTGETVQGIVDSVKMSNGIAMLVIDGTSVELGDVVSVAEGGQ